MDGVSLEGAACSFTFTQAQWTLVEMLFIDLVLTGMGSLDGKKPFVFSFVFFPFELFAWYWGIND